MRRKEMVEKPPSDFYSFVVVAGGAEGGYI